MDVLTGAVTAVDLDNAGVQRWFGLVGDVYQEFGGSDGGDDWPAFRERLTNAAQSDFGSGVANDFADYLESNGGLDAVRQICDAGPATLAQLHADLLAEQEPDGEDDGDSELWDGLAAEFGEGWAEWDGTEEGWEQYRDWFYDAANSQDEAAYALAHERLDPLNAMDLPQRIAALCDFGFTITAAPPEEAVDPEAVAEAVEAVMAPAMDELMDQIPEMAAELGISEDELRAQIDALGEDFFRQIATEEVGGAA
jgi:hypothetical protein